VRSPGGGLIADDFNVDSLRGLMYIFGGENVVSSDLPKPAGLIIPAKNENQEER
jgi:hypothetical protein